MRETADLNGLTLAEKVGQLFFIGIGGPELDDEIKQLLAEVSPGGVCLFARNIREASQTRTLLDGLHEYLPVTPFLSVDQEGGRVDRLRRIMTPMPAASKIRNADDAGELGLIIGETLRILGFNMDFAPVVDVIDDERSHYQNGLLSRTFSTCKEDVTTFSGAFLQTLQSGGIIGCLKHFPGLGASRVDSHEELPVVDLSEQDVDVVDLFPYWQLIKNVDVHAVMVAHAAYPELPLQETDQNGKLRPASLSYNLVTNLLRANLGFDGLVITDDLEMGAIVKNYGIGEACKLAVNAGADMLAICVDPEAIRDGHKAILAAVQDGEIDEARLDASLARISALKNRVTEPATFDEGRLRDLSDRIASLNGRLS